MDYIEQIITSVSPIFEKHRIKRPSFLALWQKERNPGKATSTLFSFRKRTNATLTDLKIFSESFTRLSPGATSKYSSIHRKSLPAYHTGNSFRGHCRKEK
jgi:hypothetical protein